MVATARISAAAHRSVVFTKWRQCAPRLMHGSLGPHESVPQMKSWLVQPLYGAHDRTNSHAPRCIRRDVCNSSSHLAIWHCFHVSHAGLERITALYRMLCHCVGAL